MGKTENIAYHSILVVDDDDRLRELVTEYLEGYGYAVLGLPDGSELMAVMECEKPSLVVLDVMLPGRDGLDLLRELRTVSRAPVIMLTAKGEDSDRIVGLELGADDYLAKPFNPRELLARVRAVLRRSGPDAQAAAQRTEADGPEEIRLEVLRATCGLVLDCPRQVLIFPGADGSEQEEELSLTECRVLETLMKRPNRAVSRDTLMNRARGREFSAFDRSIDVHVSRLRAKLADHPEYKDVIRTVWGTGYMFADAEQAEKKDGES